MVSHGLAGRVAGMLESFTEGLAVMPSAGRVAEYLVLTVLFWAQAAAALACLARGFGFELGAGQALSVLTMQVMGVMIPAGPGMIGTMQFFTQLGLVLFAPGRASAAVGAAFAHASWALNFGQQVGLGLFFVAIGRVQMGGLLEAVGFGGARAGAAAQPSAGSLPPP